MIKSASSASTSWVMHDNKRDTFNVAKNNLDADNDSAQASADRLDILSNGFKSRSTLNFNNKSGDTYIYMAFAESPFVNSNGVPNNAR
jgi:Ca2+-dependent lipid-binding protein